MALITVYLVKGFLEFKPPALEFDLYQRDTIDKQGNIIAVFIDPLDCYLIGYLVEVFGSVFTIKETDVKTVTVIPGQLVIVTQGFGLLKNISFGEVVEYGCKFFSRKTGVVKLLKLPFRLERRESSSLIGMFSYPCPASWIISSCSSLASDCVLIRTFSAADLF
jgi:hypothetical protein